MKPDFKSMRNWDFAGDDDIRRALKNLPSRIPTPKGLTTSLRVLASKERQRSLLRQSFRTRCYAWADRLRLAADNAMRPLALPFAGGVFSAIALFSMCVVPTYPLHVVGSVDVPTILTTEATVKGAAPLGISGGASLVVDVTVDDQGRMVDYSIVSGAGYLQDATLRRRLENMLMFTEFVPATSFGRPTSGRIRIPLFAVQTDVRG
jgi:hypothetical protein